MAEKLIVVIGATGNQGGSVVQTFLELAEWKIRGLTRNVGSSSAKTLQLKGVEMVSADLDDVTSLEAAFRGASVIFAATDFWTGFRNPANASKVAPGQTLLEWAHDYELQQGKNIFEAASGVKGLERLIFSALSHATKWSKGKTPHVYHFDSEARAVEYAQTQYPELMKKTSLIQIGMYLTNMLLMPHYQPRKDANGVYVFEAKLAPNRKIPFIATIEDTGPLTKALVDNEPGKHLLAYREEMSFNEFTEAWGRVHSVKATYELSGPNSGWANLPDDIRLDIEDGAAYISEFGYDGGDPSIIHPSEVGVHLPSVEDWIKKQNWSAVL